MSSPTKIKARKLYLFLFFRPSIRPPQTTGKCPPPHVPPGRVSSATSHPPPTPSLRWLLCIFIERQAPKTGVRPSLNFSMCAIGVPQSIYSAAASPSLGVRCLHKSNREPRPWRMIRWRGRAKPLGVGRCSDSSCVCVFVCEGAWP